MKALLLLLLFCGSTVGSFATVHQCGDKITDIDILSVADCEHEKEEVLKTCQSHCCHEKSVDNNLEEEVEDDCCSTSKLSSQSLEVLIQNSEKTSTTDLLINSSVNAIYNAGSANQSFISIRYKSPHYYRDILLEIQCFRI